MRTFISINWSASTLELFQAWQRELQGWGVKGYWRRGANLHLTLKFLGEIRPDQVQEIDRVLRAAAAGMPAFALTLAGLGVFPNLREPRILWAGVQSGELYTLQDRVERGLVPLGFSPEKRGYHPHLTLASGGISGLTPKILAAGERFHRVEQVSMFELMESVVHEGGRRYRVLAEYPLAQCEL